ncbi:MAG: hypothetical protein ABW169_01045 [Sphingobium sp.]
MASPRNRRDVEMRHDRRARGPVAARRELWWRRTDDGHSSQRPRVNQSEG